MREAEPQWHSFQLFRFIHHRHTANGIISFLLKPIYAQKVFCVFRSRGESKKFGKTFLFNWLYDWRKWSLSMTSPLMNWRPFTEKDFLLPSESSLAKEKY
jgi:hypothetical protein